MRAEAKELRRERTVKAFITIILAELLETQVLTSDKRVSELVSPRWVKERLGG